MRRHNILFIFSIDLDKVFFFQQQKKKIISPQKNMLKALIFNYFGEDLQHVFMEKSENCLATPCLM